MLSQTGLIFFRLLLNKFAPGKQEALIKLLPQDEIEALAAYSFATKDPKVFLIQANSWLQGIHPSWIEEPLMNMPESVASCIKKALGHNETIQNAEPNQEEIPTVEYPEKVKKYLFSLLHKEWKEKELLPKELLQETPLQPLLQLNREEIIEISDLLAIDDIVDEVRKILDRKLLQSLLQELTPNQQHYLRHALRHKSKAPKSPIQLLPFLKEPKKLAKLLHKRGLQKLASALLGLDPDFIEHILRTLDVTRAKFLRSQLQTEEMQSSTSAVQLQIIQILQFLKQKTSSEQ